MYASSWGANIPWRVCTRICMLSSLEDFSLKAYTKNYDQICCARDIGKWFLDCYNTYIEFEVFKFNCTCITCNTKCSKYDCVHFSLKFWSCCQRKTTEFDVFLDQEGCQTGNHLWIKPDVSMVISGLPFVQHRYIIYMHIAVFITGPISLLIGKCS